MVLFISGVLLVAAVSLAIAVYKPSVERESLPLEVKTGVLDRREPGVEQKYVPGEVVVKFKKGGNEGKIEGIRKRQGAEEVYVSPFSSVRRWSVPSSKTVEEWANFLEEHPLVKYAEPNYFCYALEYPNDPLYGYQWHFDDDHTINPDGVSFNPYGGENGGGIGMEEVWPINSGSSNVVVAVIDTGVAYENYTIPDHESDTVKGGVKTYQKAPDLSDTSFWVNTDETAGNNIDDDGNNFTDDINGWDFINNDAHP
ncbi:MAG: S8 family serine peptidase, partial [Thermoproteota archaeon]